MADDLWLDAPSDPVLSGLAGNPAAPADVLLRLVASHGPLAVRGLRRRAELPPAVIEAMLHHPAPRVRGALATSAAAAPEVRARLAGDLDRLVAQRVFDDQDLPLPDAVLRAPLDNLDRLPFTPAELRGYLLDVLRDRRLLRLAARHPQPAVRAVAFELRDLLDAPLRRALLADDAPEVRAAAAEELRPRRPDELRPDLGVFARASVLSAPLSPALAEQVLAGGRSDDLAQLAANPTAPPSCVEVLLRHPSPDVRRRLAERADLTDAQLASLAGAPEAVVRTAASTHPRLTEQQRAAIDIDVSTVLWAGHFAHSGGTCYHRRRVAPPAPADALRWATSVNPLLRRRAACDPTLPTPLTAALADDPDLGVRVLLAQHHPAAPPALLLRSFIEYTGCQRDRLPTLPGFPTSGLARFAAHPDPAVRRLVTLDPSPDPAVLDQLLTDPDPGVRAAAAACPRLPVPRLLALLTDPDLSAAAATNPSLPVPAMHHLLDTAATPA